MAKSSLKDNDSQSSLSSSREEQWRFQMEELRASTRAELLKSWAEIEQLESEKEQMFERNVQLMTELRDTKESENALKMQVQELRQRLGDTDEQSPIGGLRALLGRQSSQRSVSAPNLNRSTSSCSSSGRSCDTNNSGETSPDFVEMSGMSTTPPPRGTPALQREGSLRFIWPNRRASLVAEKERLEEEFIAQLQDITREKEELVAEMESRVHNRDAVLQNMERTQMIQGNALQRLREQLQEHDTKSEAREADLVDQVLKLKKKLKDKRKTIAELQSKLKDYRAYIDELTSKGKASNGLRNLEIERKGNISPSA